ncbi:ribonuclease HII [Rhodovibrionaceae bacterium A322]
MPDYSHEEELGADRGAIIIGVDEAGRGPWAGPVVAGAVWMNPAGLPQDLLAALDDSKKLSEKKRAMLHDRLLEISCAPEGKSCLQLGIGLASAEEIDEINILQATFLAMTRAVEKIESKIDAALIDGNKSPKLPFPCHPLIKGDGKSFSIAAASILAKTHRDRLMERLATRYPGYGWESNKGYGTRAHQAGLKELGTTPEHRRSFRPIRETLGLSY